MAEKIKLLCYCDFSCATGFSTVSTNVLTGLYNTGRYDITVFAINYWGDYTPLQSMFKLFPAGTGSQDPYGRQKFINMVPGMQFDLVFFLQDTFILDFLPTLMPHLKKIKGDTFRSVCYYPMDSTIKPEWANNISYVDQLVAYANFGKQTTLKSLPGRDIKVIPHGVDTKEFYPLKDGPGAEEFKAFKNQYFGTLKDKFIITNVNRNQQRKDIPRTMQAFAEFRKEAPDSILYLHMAQKDQGWDLPELCKYFDFDTSKDVIFPQNFGPNQGYPRPVVNALYNCSDVVVSTCLGEGFGLSWIEAMATKTPVIMPNNTAMTEFITEDKGYLVDSGTNPSLWTCLPHDNEVRRPLVDVEHMVEALLHVYNNRDEAQQKAENAYKWVTTEMDWQNNIVPRWIKLFDEEYEKIGMTTAVKDRRKELVSIEEV